KCWVHRYGRIFLHRLTYECGLQLCASVGNRFQRDGCEHDADGFNCLDGDGERAGWRGFAYSDGPCMWAAAAGSGDTLAGGSRATAAALPGLRPICLDDEPDWLRRRDPTIGRNQNRAG